MISLPSRPRPGWWRRTLARHPRLTMAVRAAVAAALAWFVARHLPDPAGDYPYYAPMGAVIATSTTLAGSVREAMQAVGSIALGGLIATGVDVLGNESNPVVLAVAVAVAVLAAGWRKLGGMGAWVPTAALFTLIIGGGEAYYVGVYAGLVFLGAAIGLAVTVAMPQLPLAPVQEAQSRLRDVVVTKLQNLADVLDPEEGVDVEEWEKRYQDPGPYLTAMRTAMSEAEEATRGNRRARHFRQALHALRRQGAALERASYAVDEVSHLVKEKERPDVEVPALGRELRSRTVDALHSLAEVFGSVDSATADPEKLRAARGCIEAMTRAIDEMRRRDTTGGGVLTASSIVMAMDRSIDSLEAGGEAERGEAEPAAAGDPN